MKMNIITNLKENSKLKKLINFKINKLLSKLDINNPKIMLKNDNNDKVVEISLKYKNHDIFIKKHSDKYEKSFKTAFNALKNKINHLN
jgi:ribosome-associated translation inhibitor RaiA